MLTQIKSRSRSQLGDVETKTRSLDQISYKPCVHSREHSFDPQFMKLLQNVTHHKIYVKFETGSCGVNKNRSLVQIIGNPCVHSRVHSFDPKFMKLCQNSKLYVIYVKFETKTCWIKT